MSKPARAAAAGPQGPLPVNMCPHVICGLEERGVTVDDMANLCYAIQKQYVGGLTVEMCRESILRVLDKREVQNAILTGLALDVLGERGLLPAPLDQVVAADDGLYGIDEILALSIVNIYGSIGFTNFGYLDKVKPGIIGRINRKKRGRVNTFLDDLVAAVVAAAAGRIAHRERDGTLFPAEAGAAS